VRNSAIVAPVKHRKTTMINAMLWQSGAFRADVPARQLRFQRARIRALSRILRPQFLPGRP